MYCDNRQSATLSAIVFQLRNRLDSSRRPASKLCYPLARGKSRRSLRRFQIPAAEHAAGIDRVNEVLVGWTFAIRANLSVHFEVAPVASRKNTIAL